MFKVHRNKLTQHYSNKQQSESESKQNWHEWKKKTRVTCLKITNHLFLDANINELKLVVRGPGGQLVPYATRAPVFSLL